mmetsp:Transcript_12530/g.23648  ORF Transcript_12530/g.23648 Transcript_12530/m.23648 type:complete len:224 (+) Transcript_12530:202-873(+)
MCFKESGSSAATRPRTYNVFRRSSATCVNVAMEAVTTSRTWSWASDERRLSVRFRPIITSQVTCARVLMKARRCSMSSVTLQSSEACLPLPFPLPCPFQWAPFSPLPLPFLPVPLPFSPLPMPLPMRASPCSEPKKSDKQGIWPPSVKPSTPKHVAALGFNSIGHSGFSMSCAATCMASVAYGATLAPRALATSPKIPNAVWTVLGYWIEAIAALSTGQKATM